MKTIPSIIVAGLVVLVGCGQSDDERGTTFRAGSDLFEAGVEVHVTEPVAGNVILAGENVEVASAIAGDALVAGSELSLKGPFESDVYTAGARVRIDGDIDGSLRAAGRSVSLSPDADVARGVSVAAAHADIAGTLHEYLQVAAGETLLDANVAGDVDVTGGSLEVGPGAIVRGNLTFRGPTPPVLAPEARIAGEVRHIAASQEPSAPERAAPFIFGSMWVLGLCALGALSFLLAPDATRKFGRSLVQHRGRAVLIGSAVVFGAPLFILAMFVSIVGVPLGFVALYAYLLGFPLGYLVTSMAVTDALLERLLPGRAMSDKHRALALVFVSLTLAGLCTLPLVGLVLAFLLVAAGLGAISEALARKLVGWRSSTPPERGGALPSAGAAQPS